MVAGMFLVLVYLALDGYGRLATMVHSRNARSRPLWTSTRIIQPARDRHDLGGTEVRVTAHRNGTAYALFSAYLKRTDFVDGYGLGDVMVFRNDAGTADAPTFSALIDPSDGLPGRTLAQNRRLFYRCCRN